MRNISSARSVPVRFNMLAPASSAARVTAGRYVSTDTRIRAARSAWITGRNFAVWIASSIREACARVDSAPRSMIAAPCARRTWPRRTAASVLRHTLSRYHESGDRLMTPMMAGWELKEKCWPPMENSFTCARAAARFFSSRLASSSRFSTARQIVNRQSKIANEMARPARIERATHCLEGSCSIQLSYGRNGQVFRTLPPQGQARLEPSEDRDRVRSRISPALDTCQRRWLPLQPQADAKQIAV